MFHSPLLLLRGTWYNLGCSQGDIWISSTTTTILDNQGVTNP